MSAAASPPQTASSGEIERYTFRERVMHWITGLTYLFCLATGLAFYSPHLYWLAFVLGGGATSRFWHPILGVVFLMGTLWMQNLWRRDMEITETDRRWLDRVENYVTNRDELLPLQERFNAGQKLFYWLMFYGALLLLFSGFFMWVPEYIPRQAAWIRPLMVLIHEIAALATIGGFIIHIYMGVFFVPDSMQAIATGWVSRAWAKTHHRLWYIRVTGGQSAEK
jgi:formate dehydrogenase subunit gamma